MKREWWHNKVAYQIYPKSFRDTNGDGIGDVRGVIEKLDYLKDLGVDIIWLSPIYLSPMADQGYDIADYYQIDPRFGTMEDMDELLAEAKKRDMHILMDLVVNHCSDEHEWFQKAMEEPEGKYGKYFYLEDAKNGRPCNWRSYFGGSVWEPLPGTDKLYFHAFHKKQPDLNWENPEVRQEIYRNIKWWLDKGLGGFRIDAIINIKKRLPFCDYPADRPDGLSEMSKMLADVRGVGDFLHEMREETFAKYQAFTVGEVSNAKLDELPEFIGENGHFCTMFDFSTNDFGKTKNGWYDWGKATGEDYKNCIFASQEKVKNIGFLANIIENHDIPRGVNHYLPDEDRTDMAKKMLAVLHMMVRGIPFIFQGQEIGMENAETVSIDEVDDVSALGQYQVALDAGYSQEEALSVVSIYNRDNVRIPVQWDDTENAGFTTGTPWLPVHPNYTTINVAAQVGKEDSLHTWYKKLIALRKNPAYLESIVYGEMIPYLREKKNLMAFYRKGEGQTILVMCNYQREPQCIPLPKGKHRLLMNNAETFHEIDGNLHMEGYQAVVLELFA